MLKVKTVWTFVLLFCFATLHGGEPIRHPLGAGDVKLMGWIGNRFSRMLQNHVIAHDPVYLAGCFSNRSENSLWQSEFWGKYMQGACPLSYMTSSSELLLKINLSTDVVLASQDQEGYIGNYTEESRFAPGTWDVWGCKYVMMGLIHHYDLTKNRRSIDAALKLCRYVASKLGPCATTSVSQTGNYAGMPSCSILEPVMWLYGRTGEKDILAFADYLVKEMTEVESGPRLLDLAQQRVPVAERSKLPSGSKSIWRGLRTNRGKAYEMMSCYQGLLEYGLVAGRADVLEATMMTVDNILEEEVNLAGGAASCEHWYHGARHQHENYPHAQETCVTVTWMRLCEKLLEITGDCKYADAFERTLYNAYLAALNTDCDEFAAYTPLSGVRMRGLQQCRMHTNCCNENGPRGFVSLLRSIAHAKEDGIFLNYYVPSQVKVRLPGSDDTVGFEIDTYYPKNGCVDIRFQDVPSRSFKFAMRVPDTVGRVSLRINGVEAPASVKSADSWVACERKWQQGDHVELIFDFVIKAHFLGDSVAFTRGPVLLARDTRFADGDLSEPIRREVLKDDFRLCLRPIRTLDRQVWMAFEAELPMEGRNEYSNSVLPVCVRFCDYASAANEWIPSNSCRTWLPIECNLADILPKEEN